MIKILLFLAFIIGTFIHIYFMGLNEVLKVADSFAYLQMSNYFNELSLKGFGNGWFGFMYSLPIAGINFFLNDNFLSSQILNIILFNLSGFLLYKIAKPYLKPKYLLVLIVLFFLSPILLHFNIAILSENIYLPLFLLTVLLLQNFIKKPKISYGITFGFLIALMYFTRGEAFIYLGAIGLIALIITLIPIPGVKKLSLKTGTGFVLTLLLFFGIFISPYVYYLNSFTGEWGLSNKGSSNIRQAIMRGKEKMDDEGFEKAVAELTPDSKYLIAGFAGGLEYNKPTTGVNLKTYILDNKSEFIQNWKENQVKLYTQNLPNIINGPARTLYLNIDSTFFYKNKIFLIFLTIPLLLFFIGAYNLYKDKKRDILIILFSFFFIASIFFTIFFTLNRYFIIFLPLFLLIIIYGIQTIDRVFNFSWTGFNKRSLDQSKFLGHKVLKIFLILSFMGIYLLGLLSYFNTYKLGDTKYEIKKIAGEWLKENNTKTNLNILERFPIVTYYSGTNNRFITPYTDSLTNLLIYAKYNKIDYLIVDTIDFAKYRPKLDFLLNEEKEFDGLEKVQVFKKNFYGAEQKVIIYKVKNLLK